MHPFHRNIHSIPSFAFSTDHPSQATHPVTSPENQYIATIISPVSKRMYSCVIAQVYDSRWDDDAHEDTPEGGSGSEFERPMLLITELYGQLWSRRGMDLPISRWLGRVLGLSLVD